MNQINEHLSNNASNKDQTTLQGFNIVKNPQCRICLEHIREEDPTNKLISPCKCTGSLKNVHQLCLEEWISKIVNKSQKKITSGKAHIFCQICKSKIFFQTLKILTCKTKEQIVDSFKNNIRTFVLLMLLLLTNLGFFSALLNYLLFVGFTILQSNNVVLVSLIISGQVIFSIVAIVTLACIINKYFLGRKLIVLEIVNNESQMVEAEGVMAVGARAENQQKIQIQAK